MGVEEEVPEAVATEVTPIADRGVDGESGEWKDGLCECCRFSPCHPSLLNAIFCKPILLGQILTRLRYSWLGNPAPESEWKQTFKKVVILFIVSLLVTTFTYPLPAVQNPTTGAMMQPYQPFWKSAIYNITTTAFFLYFLIVLCKTRKAVRDKYGIPASTCGGAEDCICAYFCDCCVLAQLARETGDYETNKAACCSETGLAPGSTIE